MAGVLCSLLASFAEGLLAETCKPMQGWSWRLVLIVLPGAEIEDVGIELPRLCKVHASRPRQQDYHIMIVLTTHRLEACLLLGSVACCWFIVCHWHWPAQGTTCWLPLQLGQLCQQSNWSKALHLVPMLSTWKSFYLLARGGRVLLDSDVMNTVI